MAIKDETLKLNAIVNGNQAQKELGQLEQSQRNLAKANKDLRIEKQKLEAQNKKNSQEWKAVTGAIKKNNLEIKKNETRMGQLRKVIGINGMTFNQLNKEAIKLRGSLKNMTKEADPKEYAKLERKLGRVEQRMDKLNLKSKKGSRNFRDLSSTIGLIGVTAGITVFSKELFDVATQLEVTEKRARIVFGQNFPMIDEEAKKVAKTLGLTNNEFINAAANTADLLVPLDFTRKQSSELSVGLTKLSGALDEWSGGTLGAAGVSEILTKAMLGENEQLKQLGIAIRKDSDEFRDLVKVKLRDEGVTKAQAEALATYELILKKSSDAQKSFAEGQENLLRKRKSWKTFWSGIKEDVADWAIKTGESFAYFGDNFDLMMNRLKKQSNELLGTSLDVEPLENFANAILHTDQRFLFLTEKIEKFGLETDAGKSALLQLGDELVRVYGKEGVRVLRTFTMEQAKLAQNRLKIARAEEEAAKKVQEAAKNKAQKEAEEKANKDAEKRKKEAERKRKEELNNLLAIQDEVYQEELAKLKDQYLKKQLTEEGFHTESEAAYIADLNARILILQNYGEQTIEIENQILDKQIEIMERKAEEERKKREELEKEEENALKERKQKEKEELERQKRELEEKVAKYQSYADQIGSIAGAAASGQIKTFNDFSKQLLTAMLDVLKKEVLIYIASVTAKEIATKGLAGLATSTLYIGLIETAFEGAKAGISQANTGYYDVIGANDGKTYTAPIRSNAKTGLLKQPTILAGEKPEIIVDPATTKTLMYQFPEAIQMINMARKMPQYAAGDYSTINNLQPTSPGNEKTDRLIEQNTQVINMLISQLNEGIKSIAYLDNTEAMKMRDKINEFNTVDAQN